MSVKYRDESRAAVGADGVGISRQGLEAAIDKHDAAFLVVQNRIYAEIQYVSVGYGFKLMVGRRQQPQFEIGRCHSSFPASAKIAACRRG